MVRDLGAIPPAVLCESFVAHTQHVPHTDIVSRIVSAPHQQSMLLLVQAGATAVVPETLEPSLQLASAVLSQLNMPQDEVAHAIQAFRKNHISELQVCSV